VANITNGDIIKAKAQAKIGTIAQVSSIRVENLGPNLQKGGEVFDILALNR
jgi:hypothetical protein